MVGKDLEGVCDTLTGANAVFLRLFVPQDDVLLPVGPYVTALCMFP